MLILLSLPNLFGKKEAKDDEEMNDKMIQEQNGTNMTSPDTNTYIEEMEDKFEGILRKVSGIGEVEVMITLKASSEQVLLKDSPYTQEGLNEDDGEGGSRTNNMVKREESTVLLTNEGGKTQPYIVQELEPEIEGVLVIAGGGDNDLIISDIIDAAEVLFDVPSHKVKVMKMSDGNK